MAISSSSTPHKCPAASGGAPDPGADTQADSAIGRREEIRRRRAEGRSASVLGAAAAGADSSKILVSVIVLNLNGAAFLGRCLCALAQQTHRNIEVIVVDNGSTDQSRAVFSNFENDRRFSWRATPHNLGCAGGRNFGLPAAKGEVIAFIDNDGFADADWLRRSLEVLDSSPHSGAAASLVFFDSDKLKLNGAGGAVNRRGYAGDLCFGANYEDAQFNERVCYPMGCGMVLRRRAAEQIFPLDSVLPKWFDDVEIGIRLWRRGFEVLLAQDAIVDHLYRTADSQIARSNWRKAFIFEAARIRHALKYQPADSAINWLTAEIKDNFFLARPRHLILGGMVWGWNLLRLPSALRIRRQFTSTAESLEPPTADSWGCTL